MRVRIGIFPFLNVRTRCRHWRFQWSQSLTHTWYRTNAIVGAFVVCKLELVWDWRKYWNRSYFHCRYCTSEFPFADHSSTPKARRVCSEWFECIRQQLLRSMNRWIRFHLQIELRSIRRKHRFIVTHEWLWLLLLLLLTLKSTIWLSVFGVWLREIIRMRNHCLVSTRGSWVHNVIHQNFANGFFLVSFFRSMACGMALASECA